MSRTTAISALWAFAVHAAIIWACVVAEYAFRSNVWVSWRTYQIIRTLDLPLFNFVQNLLDEIPRVEPTIPSPVVVAMTFTLVGGAMWAAIAAIVTLTSHWVAHLRKRIRKPGG